jgi:Zn-dependent peptidase ImmA (M78 family)
VTRRDRDEIETEAAAAASAARRRLGRPSGPILDLVDTVEELTGADVVIVKTSDGEHGMTMRDNMSGTEIIAVSTLDDPMRQRSSLAHELAHYVFHDHVDRSEDFTVRTREESRADTFARHFLLPLTDLKPANAPISVADLSTLVHRYLVSPYIAAIQLREVRLIDHPTKARWCDLESDALATRYGWLDDYRMYQKKSDTPRPPRRLLARVIRGYEQGVLPIEIAASVRGVPPETALADLDRAGVHPDINAPKTASGDALSELANEIRRADE